MLIICSKMIQIYFYFYRKKTFEGLCKIQICNKHCLLQLDSKLGTFNCRNEDCFDIQLNFLCLVIDFYELNSYSLTQLL